MHNQYDGADENPHSIKINQYQHEFKKNVWTGIIDNFIIGTVILPHRLNSENYLKHLQNVLPELLDDLPS